MAAALTEKQQSGLFSLYAGGQYKHSSIPVAEARAVVGVPHAIEGDDIPEDTKTVSKKRSRTITESNVVAKKRSNVDIPGPSKPTQMCAFCGDYGIVLSCQKPGCDEKTCVEKTDGQVPCIVPSTIPNDEREFYCPACHHKDGKPTPYTLKVFSTFYAIYHTNLPLAIYTLTMDPPEESFVANCVVNQFQEDFRGQESNLHITSTHLAKGEATLVKNGGKMTKLKSFLTRSQDPKPNFLWIIDTHSCYKTGHLTHGVGPSNESYVAPINMVFEKFTQKPVREALANIQTVKGLFIMSCGTAFTNVAHLAAIKGLVESNHFTFILGFRGFSVLPRHVMLAVVEFLRDVYITGGDIWQACVTALTANTRVLQHSPVVLIYRQGATVISKTIIYSQAKDGVWGIVPICTNPMCATQPGDVYSKTHKIHNVATHSAATWICKRCLRKSDKIKRPDWITEIPHKLNFFCYDYPFESKASVLANELAWR